MCIRDSSRPKKYAFKAKLDVNLLSKEIRKHRRVCSELKGTMELEKAHAKQLEQKINTLKQQLELVLQQNSKLETAKNSLVHDLQAILHFKEQTIKQKLRSKLSHKQQLVTLHKTKKKLLEDYMRQMKEAADKVQKEKENRMVLIQELKRAKSDAKKLEQYKSRTSIENSNINKKFIHEMDSLSHVIKFV
eukprot:TRINITY_DN18080_c0_g1_i2.p1 TRINITY_DN18080_c0_g1~~TRINITY_DN18080_c0_g1_i2.p1  ORF type:complete len:190 (-),score=56.21 TRINITY_DN18080_c0_g1_i2:69-638(-)